MEIATTSSALQVAQGIERVIRSKSSPIIGISADKLLIPVFNQLVDLHKKENLDFSDVTFVIMGEYYGISQGSSKSCYSFLRRHFFDKINISLERIRFLDGLTPENELDEYCQAYEDFIYHYAPDLWLFSLGCNGRVVFNEPGSRQGCQTRMIYLSKSTIDELNLDNIESALTVGIDTIMRGGKCIVMVDTDFSNMLEKARKAISSTVPCSYIIAKQCEVHVLAK